MKTWQKMKKDNFLLSGLVVREKVTDVIRSFFKSQGFREVFTPILVPVPSAEPNLEVFQTQLRTLSGKKKDGYLILSPEYSIKKLLAAGVGSCFEITKCFRNDEEVSRLHNPEFTMLEWYRVGADYTGIMHDFEQLFTSIIKEVKPDINLSSWEYLGEKYDISLPWPRISVAQAFEQFAGIDTETLLSEEKLLKAAGNKGYKIEKDSNWEQIFYQIFLNEIEPKLRDSGKPYFIYDYPVSQAALSKRKKSDPRFAERFEVFLAGVELGNCFSELTDPKEQRQRLEKDIEERKRLGKTRYPVDGDFIDALKSGMPEVSGIAVGVDRLIMLAQNADNISETLMFPAKELFDL